MPSLPVLGVLLRRPAAYALALLVGGLTLTACADSGTSSNTSVLSPAGTTPEAALVRTVTPVIPPTVTPTPSPTPPPTPTPSPTPIPQLTAGSAIVVGGELRTRKSASTTSELVTTLPDHSFVQVAASVTGENWLVGDQTWSMTVPTWASQWFKLSDGSFVYGAFVFISQPGEVSPLQPAPAGAEKWIDVNISTQTAKAMVGDKAVFSAPVSTGATPFITPEGHFTIQPDGRIAVEKMTATQAGYDAAQAQYDVERVLFTQYFDQKGDALHLNYWRPHSVFGKTPTSHGCVGIELHEAQYMWLFGAPGMRVEIHK